MFYQDIMCCCAVLHFCSSFYKCVECALVIVPQNVVAVSGEFVVLNCSSDVSKGNIAWSITNPGSSRKEIIYNEYVLAPSVSSYVSVSDRDDGSCSLTITASVAAAKRYICTDRDSGQEASAELIFLEIPTKCDSKTTDDSVHLNCSIVSAGNWAPIVECEQWNGETGYNVLDGKKATKFDNNVVTSIWNFTSNNDLHYIICSTEFEQTERPKETSFPCIPKYDIRRSGYHRIHVQPSPAGFIALLIVNVLLVFIMIVVIIVMVLLVKKRKELEMHRNIGLMPKEAVG